MKILRTLFLLFISSGSFAQGNLSGDLMLNANFFNRDSAINASNNPLYDNYLTGGESWLSLRYTNNGFTAFARVDGFYNSNLFNPVQAINGIGLGAWSLSKEVQELTVTAGYIYDQIGSGLLFRAYEDRGLLIDNALVGVQLKYKLADNIRAKAAVGQQKGIPTGNLTNRYQPVIKNINIEGDFQAGKAYFSPGIGALNRTLDQQSINSVAATINTLDLEKRFVPMYNMYAFTAYNTLNIGSFSWYVEGAYKTHEAILKNNEIQDLDGNIVFSTLGFAKKGIAVNFTGKRTENFVMRTSPNEILLRGMLNLQPIVARIRPQRLIARYSPASQEVSEMALGGDVLLAPSKKTSITLNYTHINSLEGQELYREAYFDFEYRGIKKWIFFGGLQYLRYNQELYQVKPNAPIVQAVTPFLEATYKINKKNSIRAEVEYMATEQDFGSWIFVLLEYNIAPSLSFALSDMYITKLNPENFSGIKDPSHYYNVFIAYSKGPNRFTASYVKQVDGINCTGGVCRYEPAFSGFKFGVTSVF